MLRENDGEKLFENVDVIEVVNKYEKERVNDAVLVCDEVSETVEDAEGVPEQEGEVDRVAVGVCAAEKDPVLERLPVTEADGEEVCVENDRDGEGERLNESVGE